MKTKLKRLLLYAAVIFAISAAMTACEGTYETVKLTTPENVRIEGKYIVWDEVENADGYLVYCGNDEYETTETQYDLSDFPEGKYVIYVKALGDYERYTDSSSVNVMYTAEDLVYNGYDEAGLEYTLLADKTGYEVSRGKVPLAGIEKIEIPDYFKGLPVKRIADYAFSYKTAALNDAVTPEESTKNCNTETVEIVLPSKLEKIGEMAFAYMLNITSIIIPDSVTEIGSCAFFYDWSLNSVTIPQNLTKIPGGCFRCCALKELILPEALEIIGYSAFSAEYRTKTGTTAQSFTEVVIPKAVKELGNGPFYGCDSLTAIYYEGSESEWKELKAQYNGSNERFKPFSDATIYCYSEEEPELNEDGTDYDGDYWYYSPEGLPVIWKKEN